MTPQRPKRGPSKTFLVLMALLVPTLFAAALYAYGHRLGPNRADAALDTHGERLAVELGALGLRFGAPVHLRIFKEDAVLEVWVQRDTSFEHFRSYPTCYFSGGLGPKTAEGDRQSPEGIYRVTEEQLNPWSRYHLSFNLGYPNEVERARGWTGSALMVHGECVSVGCYAMGNEAIEEIYLLVRAALEGGQAAVPVHAFPFRMTEDAMAAHTEHEWYDFWTELQPFYLGLEADRVPAEVAADGEHYAIR